MKRFDSIITLAFLTGIISLFLGSCTDEKQEMGTMVPLRLSLSSPVILSDSLSTRAAAPTIPFKIAPSTTPGEYAGMAKVYNATDEAYPILNFTPATPGDEVMVSRLATSTPLTIYGTAYARDIYYPFYYSGNAPLTEGTVASPLPTKMGNALIFVNTTTIGYNYKIQITALHSPEVQNDECVWDTNGKFPVVKAGSNYPDEFGNTDIGNTLGDNSIYNLTGLFASIAPATLTKDVPIMTLTEYLVGDFDQTPLATYTVYTPSAMTFEANKCYFITVNVEQKKAVMTDIQITPMTEIPIEIQAPGIYDLQDLKDFRDAWNANKAEGISNGKYDKWMDKTTNTVNLHADIDLGNEEWTPIGNATAPFTTITFDGNGHTISNLKETNKGISYGGFFGYVQETTVKGLTVKNAMLTVTAISGVIAGYLKSGTISNCHVTGTSTVSNGPFSAGIAGYMVESSTIEGCSVSNLTIPENSYNAGIAVNDGSSNGTIIACSVSDCSFKSMSSGSTSCGIGCNSSYSSNKTKYTACIAYNISLHCNNNLSPITYGGTKTACFYANVTNYGAEMKDEQGYLPTVNDLKSPTTDPKLNEALKTSSCPFHFENGEIKEGAPT